MREVCNSVCMGRCPIQLQQSFIFHFDNNKHVIIILSYFDFATDHMNKVALFSDVHKGHQAPLQLRKI
jgi:hypothetical protein